jgi:hypothetical protein
MSHKIAHIPLDFPRTASMCGAERSHPWMPLALIPRGLEEIISDVNTLLNTASIINRLGKS